MSWMGASSRARGGCPAAACGGCGIGRAGFRGHRGLVTLGEAGTSKAMTTSRGCARPIHTKILQQRSAGTGRCEGGHRPFCRAYLGHDLAQARRGRARRSRRQGRPGPGAEGQRDWSGSRQVPLQPPVLHQRAYPAIAPPVSAIRWCQARLQVAHPVGDRLRIGDVHAQEQEVVSGRLRAKERSTRRRPGLSRRVTCARPGGECCAVSRVCGHRNDSIEAMDACETRRGPVAAPPREARRLPRLPFARRGRPAAIRARAAEPWREARDATRFGPSASQNGALVGR